MGAEVMSKRLKKISVWVRETFTEDSLPSNATVRRWIESGEIPGECIGGLFYVDVSRISRTGNPNIDRILSS